MKQQRIIQFLTKFYKNDFYIGKNCNKLQKYGVTDQYGRVLTVEY